MEPKTLSLTTRPDRVTRPFLTTPPCADYSPGMTPDTAVAQISTRAIGGNIEAIRRQIPAGTPVCVAIKAQAYGHGFEQVLPALTGARVERLAVANLEESIELRRLGWPRPILCLGPVITAASHRRRVEQAHEAVAAGVSSTISSTDEARLLADAARRMSRSAHVEIQVDSGMGRLGLFSGESVTLLADVAACPHLTIDGIYTHFATADEADLTFAREQLSRFLDFIRQIEAAGIPTRGLHAANSAAVFRLPESHLDLVRPGLAVYGYWGGPDDERPQDLIPVMRVVSPLLTVRKMPPGASVGYGCTFKTRRASHIGLVPIGYADGYQRLFSRDAVMTLSDAQSVRHTVPVVGRVSMDLVTIDLTDVPNLDPGHPITIIDNDPAAPNSVEAFARKLTTIPYEIATLIGQRIPRVAVT